MSYARFSNGDVYVFPTTDDLRCCACWLDGCDSNFTTTDVPTFCAHLDRHRAAGHDVPDGLDENLWAHFPMGVYDPARAYVAELDNPKRVAS